MKIEKIEDIQLKSEITEKILRSLDKWFGLELAIKDYIENVKNKLFLACYNDNEVVGLICIHYNNSYTADIYLMGILEKYHRRGIGRLLIEKVESILKKNGFKFLMVKTLGPTNPDENYKKTRLFYQKVGFYPLEEFKEIWDEHNPCLILIKSI